MRRSLVGTLAEINDNTELCRRVSLADATARRRLFSHGGCVRIAVSLLAAIRSSALPGLAIVVAPHGPGGSSASTEVVRAGDAVDEGHVVPEHTVGETVFKLHRLGGALFLVDFESRVAAGAV